MEPGDDMSRKDLMEATGLRSSTLHDTLDRLMKEPYLLIEKVRHGLYKRTDRTIADLEYATGQRSCQAAEKSCTRRNVTSTIDICLIDGVGCPSNGASIRGCGWAKVPRTLGG
jgi:hypothetical protein